MSQILQTWCKIWIRTPNKQNSLNRIKQSYPHTDIPSETSKMKRKRWEILTAAGGKQFIL